MKTGVVFQFQKGDIKVLLYGDDIRLSWSPENRKHPYYNCFIKKTDKWEKKLASELNDSRIWADITDTQKETIISYVELILNHDQVLRSQHETTETR